MGDNPREPPFEPPVPETKEAGETPEPTESGRSESSADSAPGWEVDDEVADSVEAYLDDGPDEARDVSEAFNEASEPPAELTPVFNEAAAKAQDAGREGIAEDGLSKEFNDAARPSSSEGSGEDLPEADHGRDDWNPPRPPRPRPF